MAYTVFVSHAYVDRWVAGQVAKEVEGLGAICFLDSQVLETGDALDAELREALEGADELVVLLTPAALGRPYVWLEIGASWGRGIRIAGLLYGITTAELASRDGTPAFMSGIVLRDINEFGRYAQELKKRVEERDE
jgi:TIR domain-containing protein